MESLTREWERFSLTGKEGVKINLISSLAQPEFILVARFLTRRPINTEAITRTFRPLWRAEKGFVVKDLGDNNALITFQDDVDLERVITNGPWSYDKFLVVLQRIEDDTPLASLSLNLAVFWVQIHGLPLRCMKREIGSRRMSHRSRQANLLHLGASADQAQIEEGTQKEKLTIPSPSVEIPVSPLHADSGPRDFCNMQAGSSFALKDLTNLSDGPSPIHPKPWKRQARQAIDPNQTLSIHLPAKRPGKENMDSHQAQKTQKFMAKENSSEEQTTKAAAVQELSRLVREKDPLVLFVVETGLDEARLEKLIGTMSHGICCIFFINKVPCLGAVYVGDYNELTSIDEKVGGIIHSERQMQDFRDAIDSCGFIDLGFVGEPFTWCNNRLGSATIWERLDRGLATAEWMSMFPNASLHHIDNGTSDHCPLWLNLVATNPAHSSQRRPFRFEEIWLSDLSCRDLVNQAWKHDVRVDSMAIVHDKIRNCRKHLRSWSKNHFANISRELIKKKAWLKEVESLSRRGGDHSRAKVLKHEVTLLYGREEKMWRQRSRNNWLRCGDRNTRFFHQSATQRRRQNFIESLQDNNGVVQTGDSGVAAIFLQYFQELFKTTDLTNLTPILSGVSSVVTREMNANMGKEFIAGEVAFALKQMTPTSAPGPDSMPPFFYQTFWDSIGSDVTNAVLSCLNSGKILRAINHTYITLIPKTQSPTNVTEFRPISLCNVVYKLIAKVLANRLKKILPSIISETQSAFVPGRLITDNIFVAFESFHHMSTQRHGKTGHMALKLNMSKAYDRVEWTYLEAIMLKNGISIHLGLRQGDTLSPYLFLLCTEGLHGLLSQAEISGPIQGLSLCRNGPRLTHLFFADDCLLFCKANTSECDTILQILDSYEYASGQQLNRAKTTLFFSKYKKKPALLKSKIGYGTNFRGGGIDSSPKQARRLIRKFWWGHGEDQKKVHWVSWSKMCQPKSKGGLDFRDLRLFNEALLGKQIWRLYHCRSSLFYRVFKAKFFLDCSILDSRVRIRGSYAWRSLLQARKVVHTGGLWRVSDGSNIKIWGDNWLVGSATGQILSPRHYFPEEATVSCLINQEQHEWKTQLIQHMFLPHEASSILGIPLSSHGSLDTLIWPHTSNGRYSVRSAYHFLMERATRDRPSHSNMEEESSLWKNIWSLKVIPQIKHLVPSPLCEECQRGAEDTLHVLWYCKSTNKIWRDYSFWPLLQASPPRSLAGLISVVMNSKNEADIQYFAATSWLLWNRCNKGRTEQWSPPRDNHRKINFDGAIFTDLNAAGIGVVVRDSAGNPEAALSKMGMTFVIIAALEDPSANLTPYDNIISDTQAEVGSLQWFSFSHVKRKANKVAHVLARKAKDIVDSFLWTQFMPPDVTHVLLKDSFSQ
uniref:Reverse transcriptase domain-containing protein n=1 Tax=Fagus sylvatica TaxID=28930 RepID=A0A2N9I0P4_FAGSY